MESRETKQPPRPGVRRRIAFNCLNDEKAKADFLSRVSTIESCELIAEVTAEHSGVTLFATRRPSR